MRLRQDSISVLTIIFLAICFACFSPCSHAELVTQNDFIMMDTTWLAVAYKFPSIALDNNGIISQTYMINTIPGSSLGSLNMFNRYDRFGVQTQPTIKLLDYVDSSDVNWRTMGGPSRVYSNGTGFTMMAVHQAPSTAILNHRAFFHFIDIDGSMTIDPICVFCDDPTIDTAWIHPPLRGSLSDNGIAGISMGVVLGPNQLYDSIWARLYYSETDSLGPLINATRLPHPLMDEPGWNGQIELPRPATIGVADDGSFVVAWTMKTAPGYGWHSYYVVYNADYTPRSEVTLVECDGGPFDTATCHGDYTNRIDLAIEADGDFYIVWAANAGPPYCWGRNHLWMAGYNPDGTRKYGPLRVDDADSTWLDVFVSIFPFISCDDSGNVLVSWSDGRNFGTCAAPSCNCLETPRDFFAQKINPEGTLVGPNYRINDSDGSLDLAGIMMDADMNDMGQAAFTWADRPVGTIMTQLMPYHDVGTFIPGDINLDFSGDVGDLSLFVSYLFGGEIKAFWPRDLINFNGDESIGDVSDLTYLVDYLFMGGPPPITPYEGIRPPTPILDW